MSICCDKCIVSPRFHVSVFVEVEDNVNDEMNSPVEDEDQNQEEEEIEEDVEPFDAEGMPQNVLSIN